MRIGIDLIWLVPRIGGGMDSHVRGLLKGLAAIDSKNQYLLFTTPANHDSFEGLADNFQRVLFRMVDLSIASRLFSEQVTLGWQLNRHPLDVLHSPGFTMPFLTTVPRVFTVHDLKEFALPGIYPTSRLMLRKYFVEKAIRHADAIISVSSFTRQDIVNRFNIPVRRISVVHNAADTSLSVDDGCWLELAQRLGIRTDYIVAFSSRYPHKNIAALLKAIARPGIADHVQLVVVGHLPNDPIPLTSLADRLGMAGRVLFTGYLSEGERTSVLAHAKVLAFPSLYEGFGTLLLEAMNAGVPIACADVTALPEVAGRAALFFDPLSVNDIASALQRLLADESLRQRLVLAGRKRARDFSWELSASQTLKVYERVARPIASD
ncbi:MAG: glycosyltransferase family 4 protein [Candidatus Binataceae bacterium]